MGLSGGWRPNMLSGCVLWLDADTISGNDGDAITTWANSAPTGSANNVTQATAGSKPTLKKTSNGINGHNVARFDGTADHLAGTFDAGSTGLTVYYICRTGASPTIYGTILGSGGLTGVVGDNVTAGVGWAWTCGTAADGFGAGWGGAGADIGLGNVGSGAVADTVYYARYATDKVAWAMDGVNTTTPSDTSFPSGTFQAYVGQWGVGAGPGSWPYRFMGDIAEILVFNRKLTGPELAAVKKYLFTKYGL